MIKVTCEVMIIDTKEVPNIRVHNHWNESDKVEIEINGKRYVVVAKDLIQAIKNCTNTARY